VQITLAPASLAKSGIISGSGLAIAIIIEPSAISLTISGLTNSGPDTPMKTSAPLRASVRLPDCLSRLVTLAISSLAEFIPSGRPS